MNEGENDMAFVTKVAHWLFRNSYSLDGNIADKKKVNLEWWKAKLNIGDILAKAVYDYMIEYYKINKDKYTAKTIHLNTIGSIIAMSDYDAVIWGSGIHCASTINNLVRHQHYVKYDVRAVRGPITEKFLETSGYKCPHIYGDPAVLMPLIYKPADRIKVYDVSVIMHLSQREENNCLYHCIDVATDNYMYFIEEICKSKLIVSSSLHGIILAESYGVPAILWRKGIENEEMKFYDWYFSTGRHHIVTIDSLDGIGCVETMPLPNLDDMRRALMTSFPRDLWE